MTKPVPAAAIRLRGIRHNNLKNFDLDLPFNQLIVITGLSGSGKSSLAFDTLFAEGQRRYIETFSPYARQFFDRMDKPQVDRIDGIPPAVAIEQRNSVKSTRSTVGTMTELCDYMKLLWPHLAQLHCKQCGQPVRREPPQYVWDSLRSKPGLRQGELLITFDLPLSDKLSLAESLALVAKQGYQRLLAGNEIVRIDECGSHLPPHPSHLIVVQDRLSLIDGNRARFIEACEQAYHFGKGRLSIHRAGVEKLKSSGIEGASTLQPFHSSTLRFSSGFHCARCDLDYREPTPALFSFNHPIGACPACKGFGRVISIDYDLAIPDRSKTLAQGCVKPWQSGHGLESQRDLMTFCKALEIPTNVPFEKLPGKTQDYVINGDPGYGKDEESEWPRAWYGVKGYFRWLESKAYKMHVRVLLSRYRAYTMCPDCQGQRFQPDSLLYRVTNDDLRFANDAPLASAVGESETARRKSGLTLADFYQLSVDDALRFVGEVALRHPLTPSDPLSLVLNEVRSRLRYLVDVGLGYLTLDRPTRSLSGGETERVNLTTCLGTRLVNTLFVLDEPSVGLHPRDTARLVRILENLRDTGNTVVVVEHEGSVMRAADQIVDLGPGQGEKGGELVFYGPVEELLKSERSLTGQYLGGRKQIEIPGRRFTALGQASGVPPGIPAPQGALSLNEATLPYGKESRDACPTLQIVKANRHNLKDLTVDIPLQRFVCLTGVSGSGKTTLAREVLLPALEARLKSHLTGFKSQASVKPSDRLHSDDGDESSSTGFSNHPSSITGWESLNQIVLVDQSPLGKTPRSNPVVYIGAFDDVREIFAQTDLARQRGLNASAFSFNSGVGQCERCRGAGFEKIEMQFLSDVFIRCPDCNGRRYREHILEIKINAEGREWSVADLLEATVDDSLKVLLGFIHLPAARRALSSLRLLQEVGLGYLRLGQPINTLSGGESQRLKLVSHLAESAAGQAVPVSGKARKWESGEATSHPPALPPARFQPDRKPDAGPSTQRTLFLFDEPTTGLHFDDVRVLLQVFQRLVEAGHSVLVIEHNLDVIKCADWIIDLGPDAGARGGQLVAAGTPEDVAACEASHTGRFLREVLATGGDGSGKVGKWVSGKNPSSSHFPTYPLTHSRTLSKPGTRDAAPGAIQLHGAREHNLKNLSLEIPRGQFVVLTGVSGSGKSTLAFDILFAEGQRRFLDSMSTYARQFVEQLARPDVDLITGLPPTVSIEQRTTRGGGKSTVATVTEVYHFLRLLFARLGTQHCPDCQLPVEAQTRDQLAHGLQAGMKKRGDLLLLAPVVRNRKGFHTDVAEWAARHGYKEIRADGKIYNTAKPFRLDRFKEHDVEIVVGVLEKKGRTRVPGRKKAGAAKLSGNATPRSAADVAATAVGRTPQELIDETLKRGRGTLFALDNHGTLTIHSTERACPRCARSFAPLDPKMFSYNSSQGWCPKCRGFGELFYLPEVERGANADAIEESWFSWQEGQREKCPDCHGARLNPVARSVRLNVGQASSLIKVGQASSLSSDKVGQASSLSADKAGQASSLSPASPTRSSSLPRSLVEPRTGKGEDRLEACPTLDDFSGLSVSLAHDFFRKLKFRNREALIARDILPEISERLKFLSDVGLGYLQLGRGVTTLSGGEAQRIRLAAQLGSNLSGVLYVLDEPTIGLHSRDNEQLLAALHQLQARGNSLVVVEHDEETMRRADYIIDLGPGAGVHGGEVVAAGTLKELLKHEDSITGQCLRAQAVKNYPARGERRVVNSDAGKFPSRGKTESGKVRKRESGKEASAALSSTHSLTHAPTHWLTLHHARANNLKDLTVRFPLNRFVVVTGVSGSGKSTLIRECLVPAAAAAVKKVGRGSRRAPSADPGSPRLEGFASLKAVYEVDQSPIGRTPRSTPATYVGFFDEIRALFAQTPEARMRGYTTSRFSFNSAQGRCPECEGAGNIKLEMNFLPPAFVRCETCGGSRFNRETLDIQYAGKHIAQVLDLSVEEAIEFFKSVPKVLRPLQALRDTGLHYLKLGQTSPTLSGGEAQRVKLVTHLLTGLKEQLEIFDPRVPKRNLFILEEPTIGLHMSDVHRLVEVLQRLVEAGHSVIVIEHNLDLVAEADWVIDLGPEGGAAGGHVVIEGTPEAVSRCPASHTGRFLRQLVQKDRREWESGKVGE